MNTAEHIRTLDRIYTAALRHHAYTHAQFVAGVYDSDHTRSIDGILRRAGWLATLCEVAHRHFSSILSSFPLRPSEVETARRAAYATYALANAALHYVKAYAWSLPNGHAIYDATFIELNKRING